MTNQQKTARAERAAIHAADLTKNKSGTRLQQDIAAITAKYFVLFGYSAATAVESGYRAGIGLHGILHA